MKLNVRNFSKIAVILAIVVSLPLSKSFSSSNKDPEKKKITKKEFIKKKDTKQIKPVRCGNCPNNCLIKPNKVGACGGYTNIDGKIVPTNK